MLAKNFVFITCPFYFFECVIFAVLIEQFAVYQDVTAYLVHTQILSCIAHIISVYYFCYHLSLGFYGICLATGVKQFAVGFHGLLLVKFGDKIKSFSDVHLFSKETITNLKPLLMQDLKAIGTQVWLMINGDAFVLLASYLGQN